MTAMTSAALFLAQGNSTGPEFGKASPIGIVVILVLLIGTVVLIRSMNGRLKKLPTSFEPADPRADQEADEGTDRGAVDRTAGRPEAGRNVNSRDLGDRPES